jgi:preprotein translocase subunit YajC
MLLNRFLFFLNSVQSPVLGAGSGTPEVAADPGAVQGAAETAAGASGGGLFDFSSMGFLAIWAVVLIGMYFLMMRPQRKREKQMKEMQSAIKPGDNVVTSGGLFGRVADVGEDCFIIEFGTNRGIRIPVKKTDVLGIRDPKTTPPPKDAAKTE